MIEQIYHILCRVISEEVFRSSTMLQVEFDMPKPKSVLILFERWFFLTFFGKKWKKCIKTQVAIDKNVIKMKLKHKWFILAQDKGPQGYVCSYEHTRRTTKKFPLPCIGVSMYTTRFVYKNGGTPNAKTCGAPTQSKKIRTSPSSLLFLKSDIHLPIISNEKRGSCFLRLHSSNSKEQENLVHSYCENLQRTIQVYKNFP